MNIGQSIHIRGELTGNEDLTIEGTVEGKIFLKEHSLTIGPNGKIKAEVGAKSVIIRGEIQGNITATDKVEMAETGRVNGDVTSPRIVIADGARFKGSVDMSGGHVQTGAAKGATATPRPTPGPAVITDTPTPRAAAGN